MRTRDVIPLAFELVIPVACVLVLFLKPSTTIADEGPEVARELSRAGVILPLEKIVESAKAIKPGQILETELDHKADRYIYEIDILDSKGQVWEVELDAKTGKLIKLESED